MQISTEYRKGVFFIRLIGRIDNERYLEKINLLIEEVGISNIVLNIDELKDVSLDSVKHIIKYNNKILKKKKHLLICDSNQRRNRLFKDIIPNIQNEIEAFSLI